MCDVADASNSALHTQVSERASIYSGTAQRSQDLQLSAIEDALSVGQLSCAAAMLAELPQDLFKHSEGAQRFIAALRTRALAEQSTVLLNAHAAALASSGAAQVAAAS